jgi:nitroreductase
MLDLIKTRRSIRKFKEGEVSDELIDRILISGSWAPSGLNNQPWRFAVIKDQTVKEQIAGLTHYSKIVRAANALIIVFLDNGTSYDRTKDVQSIGACIENMLLAIHGLGLGGVWLGEILRNREAVAQALEAPEGYELMAVIAFGIPAESPHPHARKPLSELVFYRR